MTRSYEVQGEYEYWVVYEYRDASRAVYSQIRGIRTKKLATEIAAALNNAYAAGRKDLQDEAWADIMRMAREEGSQC